MPERAPVDVGWPPRCYRDTGDWADRGFKTAREGWMAASDEAREIWRSVARDDGEPDGVDDVDDADALSPWPTPLGPDALIAPLNGLVDALAEHTEADEAALAYQYLVGAGHLLGRHRYVVSDGARQYPNLYLGVVGATGIGRKGTGWAHVKRILRMADGTLSTRIVSGFNSAEGLIDFVHDEIVGKAGKDGVRVIDSPNVEDKRVLVVETEFARMLRVMARDGSTLSAVFRMAFDDGDIHVPSKTAKNRATGAHVSLVGHITRPELQKRLAAEDRENGFANRMLWCASRRSKLLPRGSEPNATHLGELAQGLRDSVEAESDGPMCLNDAAQALYDDLYLRQSLGTPASGFLGEVTARGPTMVIRMALILALLNRARTIAVDHVRAAHALWLRSVASAAYALGAAMGDPLAEKLIAMLRQQPAGTRLTTTQLYDVLGRNCTAARLQGVLAQLEEHGTLAREAVSPANSMGRPTVWWWLR